MKNVLRLTVSVAISAVMLYFALNGLSVQAFLAVLRNMDLRFVLAFAGAMSLTQVARAMRWHVLVQPFCPASRRAIWRISNVGNMLIMMLPLRLGEFARPYLMKKEFGTSLTAGMGAAVVERILDGLVVTLMFFLSTYTLDEGHVISPTLRLGAVLALCLFSGAFVVIALTLLTHGAVQRLIRQHLGPLAPGPVEKLTALLDAFVQGMRALPDVKAATTVIGWTLAYWCVNALGMYWLMCGFGWDLPVVAGVTVVCVLVIVIMIPAGPAAVGVYQAAIITGLGVYGVTKTDAASYSLVAWFLTVLVLCSFGLPYFVGRGPLRMADMMRGDAA
jgi:uncharacterized protein (TIRG00374 family)